MNHPYSDGRALKLYAAAKKLIDTKYEGFVSSLDKIRLRLPANHLAYYESIKNGIPISKPDSVELFEHELASITKRVSGEPIKEYSAPIKGLLQSFEIEEKSQNPDMDQKKIKDLALADLIDFSHKFLVAESLTQGKDSKIMLQKALAETHVNWAKETVATAKRRQEWLTNNRHQKHEQQTPEQFQLANAILFQKYKKSEIVNSQRIRLYQDLPLDQWDKILNRVNQAQDKANASSINSSAIDIENVLSSKGLGDISSGQREYDLKYRNTEKKKIYFEKADKFLTGDNLSSQQRDSLKSYYYKLGTYIENGLYGNEPTLDEHGYEAFSTLTDDQRTGLLSVFDEVPKNLYTPSKSSVAEDDFESLSEEDLFTMGQSLESLYSKGKLLEQTNEVLDDLTQQEIGIQEALYSK
jgi:hypothetical protein